ncbi:hypothetical protein JNO48_12955 [Clostridiales bacterium]|nr:hypothetical protein JNO48_12955 [Clostridiales bacterium]
MVRFSCPKCGGMYLKDGRCETCGFVVDEARANRASQTSNTVPSTPEESGKHAPANRDMSPSNTSPTDIPKTLMVCPDCGRWISRDAISCPQCGCVFPGNMEKIATQSQPRQSSKSGTGILGIIAGIVIGGLILWYLAAPYTTPLWLQHIGGTIKAFFEGKETYTVFDPSKLGR